MYVGLKLVIRQLIVDYFVAPRAGFLSLKFSHRINHNIKSGICHLSGLPGALYLCDLETEERRC
jgi:hypothetical protein